MRLVRYTHPHRSFAPAFARAPLTTFENEIDRLFQAALSDFVAPVAAGSDRFPVDLYEDKENTYVRAELPGVDRNDINVQVVDDYLTITASRKVKDGDNEQSFSFSRSVAIPESVQADKVAAKYENGVLTVTLPKKEEAKPRKIDVSVN